MIGSRHSSLSVINSTFNTQSESEFQPLDVAQSRNEIVKYTVTVIGKSMVTVEGPSQESDAVE